MAGRLSGIECEADLSGESAEDLVEMTTWTDDPPAARSARAELWTRFRRYVWAACHRAYGSGMQREEIEDLVVDTFVRAFECAGTFQNENLEDKGRARRKVGAWLCMIARRLAIDRQQPITIGLDSADPRELARAIRRPSSRLGPLARKVRKALTTPGVLNAKEIVVLREWAEHYDPDRDQQRLPEGVTEELAKQLNVQPESIRQILRRGLKRLRESLEDEHGLAGAKAK